MSTLHHESIFETILDEVCEEFGIEYDPMGDPDVNHVIDCLLYTSDAADDC